MDCGHIFNGIGGFALAAQWMGWNNLMHCEIDDFCNKVMANNFPQSIQYGDITTTDFTIWNNRIDVLSAGWPCQPFSQAGEQLGEDHEQYLVDEMLRAFEEIKPRYGLGENVPGITSDKFSKVFSYIYSSLENIGYKIQAFDIPASAVEAVHERRRIWFIAYASSFGCERREQRLRKAQEDGYDPKNRIEGSLRSGRFGNNIPASRIFRGTNGVPNGIHRVHALGNAIVPPIAYELFKTIEQFDYEFS